MAEARRAVACLATLAFFLSMDVSLTNLLVEPMKREMTLSDVQVGLLQGTAFGVALGIGSLPFGRLVDRARRVPLLRLALLVWIAAMAATGLARDLHEMMVARVVLGLVAALLVPAAISLIADFYPPERRSVATSLFIVGQALGQACGMFAGGYLLGGLARLAARDPALLFALSPWRATYIVAAGAGALLLIPLVMLREPERQGQAPQAGLRDALSGVRKEAAFLLPLLAALLLAQFTAQAASVWSPAVLTRRFLLSPDDFVGWLGAILLIGGIAGAFAGGRLGELGRRRGGPRGALIPALVACIAIAPASFFGLASTVPLCAFLLCGDIFFNAVVATLGAVVIALNVPNELRGLVLGANSFLSGVFSFGTAPAAIAVLSRTLGGESMLGTAIAIASTAAALLAGACFAVAKRDRLPPER